MGAQKKLTGRQKAAAILIMLEKKVASEIIKHIEDQQIVEALMMEIAKMRQVPSSVAKIVLDEFESLLRAKEYVASGGIKYAQKLLEEAFGPEIAKKIVEKLTNAVPTTPFKFIQAVDPSQLINFIQNENPQVIAIILAYLPIEKAATLLAALDSAKQVEVVKRLAVMDRTNPEILKEIEEVLQEKLSEVINADYTMVGGFDAAAQLLNNVDRSVEKLIMEKLEQTDPEVAQEIRKRMFVFEDIIYVDDRGLQRALREIKLEDLALALKKVEDERVKEKFLNNMPKRMQKRLLEEMEYMGPVRLKDVQDAQQRIINIIRRLEEEGEIVISRGGKGEELIV